MIPVSDLLLGDGEASDTAAEGDESIPDADRHHPVVVWHVTGANNLDPAYGTVTAGPGRGDGELSTAEAIAVIDDLAATVLAHERGTEPDAVPRSECKAVRDEFFATHLPKLTATEVVEYDSMVGTLRLPDEEQITDHLA